MGSLGDDLINLDLPFYQLYVSIDNILVVTNIKCNALDRWDTCVPVNLRFLIMMHLVLF